MKLIEQSYKILKMPEDLRLLEVAGRTCYQSSKMITEESTDKFVKMLVNRGHHAMIEFEDIVVVFIINRGVLAEFTRHRMCSYAVESTRYVKYDDIEFIKPVWWDDSTQEQKFHFKSSLFSSEEKYRKLIDSGWRAEQAREVLPNALKTEIVVKANLREWRHFLKLRTAPSAHPDIRELAITLLEELQNKIPLIFDDIL